MMKKLKCKETDNNKKKEEKVTPSKAVTIVHNNDVVVEKKFSNSCINDESLIRVRKRSISEFPELGEYPPSKRTKSFDHILGIDKWREIIGTKKTNKKKPRRRKDKIQIMGIIVIGKKKKPKFYKGINPIKTMFNSESKNGLVGGS